MNFDEMTTFESMTNFEVNKKLAGLIHGEHWWWRNGTVFTEQLVSSDCGGMETKRVATNYCRSWEDIGPLIERYLVDIEHPIESLGSVATCSIYIDGDTDIQVDYSDKSKTKRAAAICIIKLLESNNEKCS